MPSASPSPSADPIDPSREASPQPHLDPGLLADHYHRTFELTYTLWRQRNRSFLLLVVAMVAALLMTLDPPWAQSVLVQWVGALLAVRDPAQLQQLTQSPVWALLEGALLVPVFYLMVTLYHRSAAVLRYYRYLGLLERDIRSVCRLPPGSVAFTREGQFYWVGRPRPLAWTRYAFVGLLGVLLFGFVAVRFWHGVANQASVMLIFDVLGAGATLFYFGAYAHQAVRGDHTPGPWTVPSGVSTAPSSSFMK